MIQLVNLSFINHERYLPATLDLIGKTAKALGLPHEKVNNLVLVAEELILRRLKNAFEKRGYLTMELACNEKEFEFSLQDKGTPYWSVAAKIGELVYNPKLSDKSYDQIRQMVDFIGTEFLGLAGQKTIIRMNIPRVEIRERTFSENKPKDLNFHIIEVTSEQEILQAELCIWDEYGYSYSFEKFYQPPLLKETIESGEIRSYLVLNEHGEVAGHYALMFSRNHPGLPELASVVVRHNFRRYGVFSMMMAHGVEQAQKLGYPALLTKPVLYHTATQHVATKLGFVPTAVAFDHLFDKVESEYNHGKRLSVACSVLLFQEKAATLYAPVELQPLIEQIYQKLGKDYQFVLEESKSLNETSCVRSDSDCLTQSGGITVEVIGKDFAAIIKEIDRDFTARKIEVVEALLPLEKTGCQEGYRLLKELGYFFTGVIPGGVTGDLLMMQKVITALPSCEGIVTEAPYTELVTAILKEIEE